MANELPTRCVRCSAEEVLGTVELLEWMKGHGPGRCAIAAPAAAEPEAAERYTAPERVPATHRIEGERFYCDGDAESKCHWWPDCDDEAFPCDHDYVSHGDDCWILDWLNASVPEDTDRDEGEHRDEDLHYPDGPIAWDWEDDYILWSYATEPTALAVERKEGQRA